MASTLNSTASVATFRLGTTTQAGLQMALASLTAAARAISLGVEWTDARCPSCNWRVMSIPGRITVNVVAVSSDRFRSGLGRCCVCRRCKTLCEVIEE